MAIKDSILPEFDHELATTRRLLERVPEQQAAWKPHARSMSLGDLTAHLANIPFWGSVTMKETELNFNPPGGSPYKSPGFDSTQSVLDTFDRNTKQAREAIGAASDQDFMVPWTLKNGEQTIFTLPRVAVLRSFVMNHLIHHRGQLSVYLRLNDVPVPSIYGPSADEQ
ncbi:MAG TPA: DinB family protein [Thermoanaerobaculia bacterium]|nr:DinB family protein [Thermoanaerobaculia bacterium]